MASYTRTSSLKAGLPPGTPVHVGEQKADAVKITVVDYNPEGSREFTPESPKNCTLYRTAETVTWINVDGLHEVDLIGEVCSCFGIHPLTVEDILNTTQRPKLDVFDDYLFLVIKTQTYNPQTFRVEVEQVSLILGDRYLLSFRERPGDAFDGVRSRILGNKGRIRKMGADYLAYTLLDAIIDNYYAVLERVGETIEELEEELVGRPTPETLKKIHLLKREMILLRRSVWPLREVISSLLRDEELSQISKGLYFYLKDLYDHTVHVIDTIETFRDIISGMLEIYLSSVSNRLNEIMKVLTIFAAIFIPLTFIAGVYGMNFNTAASPFNMPELNWFLGYPFALFLMAATAGGMLAAFRRKGWL